MNQQRLRPDETELNQQDPEGTRLNRPTKPLPTTPGPHSTHLPESTHSTHEPHVEESSTIQPAKNQESPFGLTLFLYGTVALMVGIIAWIIALLANLKG